MKRIISLAIVAIMLFACVAAAIPVSAAASVRQDVEAIYFDVKPTIDGYVTEEEWGTPAFFVDQSEAATVDSKKPSDSNTFFYRNGGTYDSNTLSMSYTGWLGWDEECFYIAVQVYDPDGHSLKNGRTDTWNGDAVQTRIDPAGPNAICDWDGEWDPDYFSSGDDKKPWSSASVCDFVFGWVQNAGGFTEAYENVSGKSMIERNPLGACEVAVTPAGVTYSKDSANGITTYEAAILWAYIDSWYYTSAAKYDTGACHEYYEFSPFKDKQTDASGKVIGRNGGIGKTYGMSLAVLNANGATGAGSYNAYLTWGSGVCSTQEIVAFDTCGGNNQVVLSGTKISEDSYSNANYETKTKGGYVAPVIQPNYDTEIDTSNYVKLTYDNEDDMEIIGWVSNGERYNDNGNWVVKWDMDTGNGPEVPSPSGYNENNYISTDGDFEGDQRWLVKDYNFTFEFDLKVTGLEQFVEGYPSQLYTWFGGSDTVSFRAGYFFDDGKFKVTEQPTGSEADAYVLQEVSADFSLNEWHHWVVQYHNESCELRFYFDPEIDPATGRMTVAAAKNPTLNVRYRYFDYGTAEKVLSIFRRLNAQIMMDNIELYNFVDYTGKGTSDIDFTSPESPVTIITKTDVVDVPFTVEKNEDGTFKVVVPNMAALRNKDVTAVTFMMTYDTAVLGVAGVTGLDEAAYTLTDDGEGNVTIVINDLSIFAAADEDAAIMGINVGAKEGADLTEEDVKNAITLKASITTTSASTGDSLIYISIALAVVLLMGTGIILCVKKRKNAVQF